jgi:rSAM/selenodomain-associated transferase 2/rSAM/selenodomain-associated transferase 1
MRMEKKGSHDRSPIKNDNLLSRLFFSAKRKAEEEEQERALSRLIVFSRFPEPGKSKTRLIPALGAAGAAELHRQMVEHTLRWVKELRDRLPLSIEIRYTGRPLEPFQRWLGPNFLYSEQGEGDLGQRMLRSLQDAFRMKVKKVLLIGTDVPDLSANLAEGALILLNSSDLVLGPADDGGYYLIGLRRVIPQLFQEIPWGTEEVFRKTQHVAQAAKLSYSLLPSLPDVDRPEDLSVWRRHIPGFREKGTARESFKVAPLISIIIPTLNEEENIVPCLEATRKAINVERIVVDGGSTDGTVDQAKAWGATVLNTVQGRAWQMNAGARASKGEILLFLHADTILSPGFDNQIRLLLSRPRVSAGAFSFRLDNPNSASLLLIQAVANWRSRYLQVPYGDQAIFVRTRLFQKIGGFPDLPIMEDHELIRLLRKRGKILTASLPAVTSARRWRILGIWRTTILNWVLILAYFAGMSPLRLYKIAHRKV